MAYSRRYPTWHDYPNISTLVDAATFQGIEDELVALSGQLAVGDSGTTLNTDDLVVQGPRPWIDVRSYGAIGDAVTDDSGAIQAAINACGSAGGGTVYLPAATYAIGTGLTVMDKPGVVLQGDGASNEPYSGAMGIGTRLLWTGSSGGTVLKLGALNTATSYARGIGVNNLTIDGADSAAIGLQLVSSWYGTYENLHIRLCTTVHLDMTTIPVSASIGEDCQGNVLRKITTRCSAGASASSIGIRLNSGATPSATQGNTSLNDFSDIFVSHYNGTGLEFNDADSNRFFSIGFHQQGGSGKAIDFKASSVVTYGHARANLIYFVDANTGGIVSRNGTTPAANNRILHYSEENGAPAPTIEAGSTLRWTGSRNSGSYPFSRDDLVARAQGFLAQSADRAYERSGVTAVDGTVYYLGIGLFASEVISNIHVFVTIVSSGSTTSLVGLYSKTGTRLAQSNDLGTAWQSTGVKTHALNATYTVPTSDMYYVAILGKVSTTMPTFMVANPNANNYAGVGGGVRACANQTGQTSLPTSASFAEAAALGYWVAVS